MSDDLISRKTACDAFSDYINRHFVGEISSQTELNIGEIASVIKSIPVAFDKKNVIAELKATMGSAQLAQSLVGTNLVQCGGFSYGYYNGVKDAIEIVEKGGLNERNQIN